VCRRLRRRCDELALPDLDAYRAYLETHPDEWKTLEALTPITISRFFRDRAVWAVLEREVLPALAADRDPLSAWSAGCASGEEPYSLALLWRHPLSILATDVDPVMLRRAAEATYEVSSLKELPVDARERLERRGDAYVVPPEIRRAVVFDRHDLRDPPPGGKFDLVLCRNVAFTYFDDASQQRALDHLAAALRPGGALVLGLHESLPDPAPQFEPWPNARAVLRRSGAVASHPTGR